MIARAVLFAWCFAKPIPLACDMKMPPTCGRAVAGVNFARSVTPLAKWIERETGLAPPRHIREHLIPHLEPALFRPVRVAVSMPPGHAKSFTVQNWVAWLMAHNPASRHAYLSYSDPLAKKASRRIRGLVKRTGTSLGDSAAVDEWETAAGGGMRAAGIGGGVTGFRVNQGGSLVLDDPHKNREEADSLLVREKVSDEFDAAAFTRIDPTTSILVMMTRWHTDDQIARLQKKKGAAGWTFISLPALDADGAALWPEAYPVSLLHEIRDNNEWVFASLYQQNPRPRGEALFSLRPAPTFDRQAWQRDGHRMAIVVDPAATAKTYSDRSALLVVAMSGFGRESRMDVVEAVHGQLTVPVLLRVLVERWKEWGACLPILIEAVGGFAALPDMVREMDDRIGGWVRAVKSTPEVKVSSDKFTRAQPVATAFNQGRVRFAGEAWTAGALEEMYAFTGVGDPHDDFVDALAHAWNETYQAAADPERGESDDRTLAFDDYGEDAA